MELVAFGKGFIEFIHLLTDAPCHLYRVGSPLFFDSQSYGTYTVGTADATDIGQPGFDLCHIRNIKGFVDRLSAPFSYLDLPKIRRSFGFSERTNIQFFIRSFQTTGGDFHMLFLDGIDNVDNGQFEAIELLTIDPNPQVGFDITAE